MTNLSRHGPPWWTMEGIGSEGKAAAEGPRVDGRTARRDRNTDTVLDAVHELFVEGELTPTVEDVAARAGVSARSIYRYFPDSTALRRAALRRRIEVAEPFFQLQGVGQGPLEERIERLVAHRLRLFEIAAPTIRAALTMAAGSRAISAQVERRRQQLAEQSRRHFAPELEALAPDRAEALAWCVDLLYQFESLELLRRGGLSSEEMHRTLTAGIGSLLGAAAPT